MLTYFFKDSSPFRRNMMLLVTGSVIMTACSLFCYTSFVNLNQANIKAKATYEAQAEWLQNYDYKAVQELEKTILRPIPAASLDKVQKEQLEMFSKHNLALVNVSKKNQAVKGKLKSVSTSVIAEGRWEDVTALLNEFEKKHLVVITNLKLSNDKSVTCKMDYSVYYN